MSLGFPHSSYSPVVNGIVSSNIVVTTSTNGTEAITPLNNSGAWFNTAPIKSPPAVIMTTAYPDYAADSFALDTIVDYLVKPFSFDRFLKAVNKARTRLEKVEMPKAKGETLFLNVDKTLHKIVIADILYIESDRNYITVVTKNKKLSYIESLKNWNEKLTQSHFIQVHKSYIINSKQVDKVSGNELYIAGNRIPVGRTYKQELLKRLQLG